jgi:hypothetical protein
MRFLMIAGVCMVFISPGCRKPVITQKAPLEYVQTELAKMAPAPLTCELTALTDGDKKALVKLIQAGRLIDDLFLLQVDESNPALRAALGSPQDKPWLDMFDVMFGSWNRIDGEKPFLNNVERPAGAAFYPADMTKQEFDDYCKFHPEQEKEFTGNFSVIRRKAGRLTSVPYHELYQSLVDPISRLLNEAAALTQDETLKKYLTLRAQALLTDDYFESDMAWMDLAGDLEVVIGPYEVYEDKLFGYKAAYEAFICIVDHVESAKLTAISGYLDELEQGLPLPEQLKNFSRGKTSPLKIVEEVYSAGDTRAGVQTTAFNLPNDERVREAKGTKKVMLKNVAHAKYENCWIPIAKTILTERAMNRVSFEAYFMDTMMHEIAHGLGPGRITLSDGKDTTVGKELKELYSTIEECKADVVGLCSMKHLVDKGVLQKDLETTLYATYLGGMFRSIRFGISEAHGAGVAIQFNYCVDKGAFTIDQQGRMDVDETKLIPTLKSLAAELLLVEAKGDYQGAQKLIDQYRIMTPFMSSCIDKLKNVPIDIRPSYPLAEQAIQ